MADKRATKSTGFSLGDYVEVKDRIVPFHTMYPEGRIETEVVELADGRVTIKASLYDTRVSELPIATGHSWMNVPGTTPYTKGSEIENAETSAVGRALAFIGIGIEKSIASKEEVANKVDVAPAPDPNLAKDATKKRLRSLAERLVEEGNLAGASYIDWKQMLADEYGVGSGANLSNEDAESIIEDLKVRLFNA